MGSQGLPGDLIGIFFLLVVVIFRLVIRGGRERGKGMEMVGLDGLRRCLRLLLLLCSCLSITTFVLPDLFPFVLSSSSPTYSPFTQKKIFSKLIPPRLFTKSCSPARRPCLPPSFLPIHLSGHKQVGHH